MTPSHTLRQRSYAKLAQVNLQIRIIIWLTAWGKFMTGMIQTTYKLGLLVGTGLVMAYMLRLI